MKFRLVFVFHFVKILNFIIYSDIKKRSFYQTIDKTKYLDIEIVDIINKCMVFTEIVRQRWS